MALSLGRTEHSVQLKCSKLELLQERINYIGQKFDRLTVKSEIDIKNRKSSGRMFLCDCDCGSGNIRVRRSSLVGGKTRSCGCLQKEIAAEKCRSGRLNPKTSTINNLENDYKQSARRRGLEYSLGQKDFAFLISSPCHYCDSEPKPFNRFYKEDGEVANWVEKNGHNTDWAKKQWVTKNGIDRIDNGVGYILGNCVTCCWICNRAKSDMSYQDFVKWISSINTKNTIKHQK